MVSIPTSGVIAGSLGWEAVFYIHGGLAIIWCFLWVIFVTDDTKNHPFMSEEEKTFIHDNHARVERKPVKVNNVTALTCDRLVLPKHIFFTYVGYPLNLNFVFQCHVKGAYLCLAEV